MGHLIEKIEKLREIIWLDEKNLRWDKGGAVT
jgi:hypothetical protein